MEAKILRSSCFFIEERRFVCFHLNILVADNNSVVIIWLGCLASYRFLLLYL